MKLPSELFHELSELTKETFLAISRVPSRVAKSFDPYSDNPLDYREELRRRC